MGLEFGNAKYSEKKLCEQCSGKKTVLTTFQLPPERIFNNGKWLVSKNKRIVKKLLPCPSCKGKGFV